MPLLKVYDVGHGNWNEIHLNGFRIFYDIGAGKYYREGKIRSIIDEVNFCGESKITIILSHWDVDHYHSTLRLNKRELKMIECIIVPTPPENPSNPGELPCTIQKVIDLLVQNNVKIIYIDPTRKRELSSNKIELHLEDTGLLNNCFEIYRSTGSANKNLDSIVLYYRDDKDSGDYRYIDNKKSESEVDEYSKFNVLLTGDNYYNKLYEYILSSKSGKHIIVVPHHGGNAGKFNGSDWLSLNINTVISSWGDNNYNHNLDKTIKKFRGVTSNIFDTKSHGTVTCII